MMKGMGLWHETGFGECCYYIDTEDGLTLLMDEWGRDDDKGPDEIWIRIVYNGQGAVTFDLEATSDSSTQLAGLPWAFL